MPVGVDLGLLVMVLHKTWFVRCRIPSIVDIQAFFPSLQLLYCTFILFQSSQLTFIPLELRRLRYEPIRSRTL